MFVDVFEKLCEENGIAPQRATRRFPTHRYKFTTLMPKPPHRQAWDVHIAVKYMNRYCEKEKAGGITLRLSLP